MTIKKKLLINMFLPIGTLLLIILVMISFQRHKDETERTNDIALSLLADVFDLSQCTDSYLLLGEHTARTECDQIYHSVSLLLDQLHFHDNDENFILERTRRNLGEMRDLFPATADEEGRRDPASPDEVSTDRERQEALSRQILTRARNVSLDALQLYNMARMERNGYSVRLHAFVLAFFLVSLLISVGTLIPINRSIAGSVAKLISGAETVGLGNLEHKIGLRTQDELGSLSRSFDAMTDSLRITTVSRDALAQEVTRRKEIEEELRKTHEELELRVRERTEELRNAYEKLIKESADRKRAEEQLRQSQKMEALGTMAGGIAHDFNNVLAAVIGFTQLVMDDVPEGQPRHHLEQILKAGLRGRDLIRQMLTFSRKNEQERQPLRLSNVIEETMGLLRASIPSTIDVRMSIKSESGFILANPVQIQQIIMNLCNNAADAMRQEGGIISIELSDFAAPRDGNVPGLAPGSYMRLSVCDTGEGIPPELLDRIFDPFFTTKEPGRGTGLGLSVVHGLVSTHNGAITVKSSPGRGTEFAVYFIEAEETPMQEEEEETDIPAGHERILFVDDEEILVEMGKAMLEGLGYRVTGETSGAEALNVCRKDPDGFDLIITDQTMPGTTGLKLAEEVRSLREIPVILVTGFSQLVDATSAEAAGVNTFMMKPLTRSELSRTIRRVLDTEKSGKAG